MGTYVTDGVLMADTSAENPGSCVNNPKVTQAMLDQHYSHFELCYRPCPSCRSENRPSRKGEDGQYHFESRRRWAGQPMASFYAAHGKSYTPEPRVTPPKNQEEIDSRVASRSAVMRAGIQHSAFPAFKQENSSFPISEAEIDKIFDELLGVDNTPFDFNAERKAQREKMQNQKQSLPKVKKSGLPAYSENNASADTDNSVESKRRVHKTNNKNVKYYEYDGNDPELTGIKQNIEENDAKMAEYAEEITLANQRISAMSGEPGNEDRINDTRSSISGLREDVRYQNEMKNDNIERFGSMFGRK